MKKLLDGLSAGIMIVLGCSVYLACSNKYVGACLFSVALLTVCIMKQSLFTGKIGTLIENHKKENFALVFLGLLGNTIAVILLGLAVSYAVPNLSETAKVICEAKLTDQNFLQTLIRAMMCGILMYVAVTIYKENNTTIGIIFAIPAFILSGFEHSIADMGYFAIANIFSLEVLGFICTVLLGNALGAFILPLLRLAKKEKKVIETKDDDKDNKDDKEDKSA